MSPKKSRKRRAASKSFKWARLFQQLINGFVKFWKYACISVNESRGAGVSSSRPAARSSARRSSTRRPATRRPASARPPVRATSGPGQTRGDFGQFQAARPDLFEGQDDAQDADQGDDGAEAASDTADSTSSSGGGEAA